MNDRLLLAEVEGWHQNKFIEGLMQRDQEKQYIEDFDYTNLEACMRVAEKLDVYRINHVLDLRSVHVFQRGGQRMNASSKGKTFAATLYPMLVEIAKERMK